MEITNNCNFVGGGLALSTPASALAEIQNSTIAKTEQKEEEKEESEAEPESESESKPEEEKKEEESEPESKPEEEEKEEESEPESKPEEEEKEEESEPESKPEEEEKEEESEPEPEPEEEPEKTHPSEARIQEIIQWIDALPEGSDENFDMIQKRYDEIQKICEEIDYMPEEDQERITNLQKLMDLMEWINQQTETAWSGTCGSNARWELDRVDGNLIITGTGGIGSSSSDDEPFKGMFRFGRVEIKEGIRWIGQKAFYGTGMKSITFPSTLTDIYKDAFRDCKDLTYVTLPGGLRYLHSSAFSGCQSLTNVSFNSRLQEIGDRAFINCNLSTVTIPGNVKRIGEFAFDGNRLTNITIEDGVEIIDEFAFYENPTLKSVVIPGSVTDFKTDVFSHCYQLQRIILNEGIQKISNIFLANKELAYIQIPETVTSIDNYAFKGCPNVTIYGVRGSYAETYANEHGIPFSAQKKELPAVSKITNTCSGSHVYWKKFAGAKSYNLYRSTSKDGTYTKIATTAATNYTDTNVKSGTTYYYKIRANRSNGVSDASTAKGVVFVETPDITLRVNRSTGIGLGWNKISGATGYAVYRKSYSGSDAWKRVATITNASTLSWVDTSVKNNNGSQYRYTVRALAGSDRKTLSGCRNTGRTMVRIFTPTISKVTVGSGSMKVLWDRNTAVHGYEVRLMRGQSIDTYTVGGNQNVYQNLNGLQKGATYKVQVRSYKKVSGVGTFYSAWSAPQNVTVK